MPQPSRSRRNAAESKRRSIRRWIVLLAAAVLLVIVFREVLFPFSGRDYVEVSHGNHSHYVPEDRDPDVPLSNFPTRPPEDDERILPDGRIEKR